ncbi:MAG: hypothetical protein ACOYS2_01920 [Patescibacteria group bacterium]
MEKEKKCSGCPECEKREKEHKDREEMNLAVLISLTPMLVLTMFNMIGLF